MLIQGLKLRTYLHQLVVAGRGDKNTRFSCMEKVMYEIKPYICLGLAFWALQMDVVMNSSYGSVTRLFALALIGLGGFIIFMRGSNRGYFGKANKA